MSLRVAFVARRRFEFQVPQRTTWADSAWFPVADDWGVAISSASKFKPDVTFVFEPLSRGGLLTDEIPGVKVGIVTEQPSQAELAEAVRRHRSGAGTPYWFTWFEDPSPEANDLPFLAVLAAFVDTCRLPHPPRLEQAEVAVPTWARPPDMQIPAEVLPDHRDPLRTQDALSRHGILLHYAKEPVRLSDAVILALGHGQLVISNRAFPVEYGLEEEDEYLVRPPNEWPKIIEKEQEGLGYFRAVRVRAWQKTRELFDASTIFRRLAHDALVLKSTEKSSSNRRRR